MASSGPQGASVSDLLEQRPFPVPPAPRVRGWHTSDKILAGSFLAAGVLGIAWLCALGIARSTRPAPQASLAGPSARPLPAPLRELQAKREQLLRRLVALGVVRRVRGMRVYVLPGFYSSTPAERELVCNMICAWVYKLPNDAKPDPQYKLTIYDALRQTRVGTYSLAEGLQAEPGGPLGRRAPPRKPPDP